MSLLALPHSGRCRLRVLTGVHIDADCWIDERPLTLGSGGSSNIFFADDGVAVEHLSFDRDSDGLLSVRALADGVTVEGKALAAGQKQALSIPAIISIGSVELAVAMDIVPEQAQSALHAPSARTTSAFLKSGRYTLPLIVGIVGAALSLSVIKNSTKKNQTQNLGYHHAAAPSEMLTAAKSYYVKKAFSEKELVESLSDRVKAMGIGGVRVSASAGVVRIDGNVSDADLVTLRNIEIWFDTEFKGRYVLISRINVRNPEAVTLPIQSVWEGENPSITIHDQTYFIGAEVLPGTRIVAISPHQITARRDKEILIFKY
ncbi:hypothetical protein J2D73_11615 [Acetobacter sacchari]|uniref:YscD/Y4YQ C-terminal domain-containing protein n=1 Tax=Acetobacter sacchari TaxID=2661687 RepID=A0ABS3LWY0_9PROT|nr:hypothetical protein [Acetobacter sacchari]MBO1360435.1 hypothetical protein [Acetobacter sacchari]